MPHIRDLLGREGRGKGRVILVPRLGTTQSVEIALPGGFNVTPRLAQAMKVISRCRAGGGALVRRSSGIRGDYGSALSCWMTARDPER